MSFVKAFDNYIDQYGFMSLYPGEGPGQAPTTDNGTLFTMEYLIALLENDEVSQAVKEEELKRLRVTYDWIEFFSGLQRRKPSDGSIDSMDNNGASLVFSAMFGKRTFAKRMKAHSEAVKTQAGETDKFYKLARWVTASQVAFRPHMWAGWVLGGCKPKFYWNVTDPTRFAIEGWWGRSPGFLGLIDLCADGLTTPFRWLGLLVGQFQSSWDPPVNTDGRKLPYVNWYFLTRKTWFLERLFWKLAYCVWLLLLYRKYKDGMLGVYAEYYKDPNHPIRTKAPKHFKVWKWNT